MALVTLASRLNSLPLVICGPILRRVIPNAVTVWVALREEATVTLTVYDGDGPARQQVLPAGSTMAERKTSAIGANLHMVAVTARGPVGTLTENKVYCYDLAFDFASSGTMTFQGAMGTSTLDQLVYPPYTLPSFALPPADLEKLRIIHGSCRKPNGGGADMLALVSDLIQASADQPLDRPHQLLMTGDQIYADEVADILLLMLTDAGDTLLGWQEPMPANSGVVLASGLPPGTRRDLIENVAGFTTDDRRSHLMSLGEYLAMYLFAWSPVLWPQTLPTVDDVRVHLIDGDLFASTKRLAEAAKQLKNVQTYVGTISAVRRALANIPSYMICDDHEITDDWNMTRGFCDHVYGSTLGMRIIQNGLVAYSLCQAWGNTPEQFEENPSAPGNKLLGLIPGVGYAANSPAIQKIVGLHDAKTLGQQDLYRVYHDSGNNVTIDGVSMQDASLRFDYTIEGPAHQVIVTDTRTWRTFPESGAVTHPDLLGDSQLTVQLDLIPPLGNRVQLVVVTTNMPPIPSVRLAEQLLGTLKGQVYEHDLYDSWRLTSAAFDKMIKALSDRFPADTSSPPVKTGRVIALSGDVHSSYASRLAYWANVRFHDPQGSPQKAKVVFAQLVASPFKNESEDTIGQHESGYSYSPHWYTKPLLPKIRPEGVLGWAVDPLSTSPVDVGKDDMYDENAQMTELFPLTVNGLRPSIAFSDIADQAMAQITRTPDYRYRLDQIFAAASGQDAAAPPVISPFGAGTDPSSRQSSLTGYNAATAAYHNYTSTAGAGRQIVGRSNVCEITFTWGAGDAKQVHHTVRWREPGKPQQVFWARYSVSLALDDNVNFPPLKWRSEP